MQHASLRLFGSQPRKAEAAEQDPSGIPNNHPGAKADAGKPRVGLCLIGFVPALKWTLLEENDYTALQAAASRWPRALTEIAKVTTAGALKYTPNGWLKVPGGAQRYLDAWGRHLLSQGMGHVRDDGPGGTGCLHEAQACWNLLAVATLTQTSVGNEWTGRVEALRVMCLCALDSLETGLRMTEQSGVAA